MGASASRSPALLGEGVRHYVLPMPLSEDVPCTPIQQYRTVVGQSSAPAHAGLLICDQAGRESVCLLRNHSDSGAWSDVFDIIEPEILKQVRDGDVLACMPLNIAAFFV